MRASRLWKHGASEDHGNLYGSLIVTPVTHRPVLLYDRDCRLCRSVARCVARLDRGQELALLPLQDVEAAPLLAALAEDERLRSWRLARPEGSLTGCGAGLPDLLETMHATRLAGRLLRRVPDGAVELVYALIARHRSALGRLVRDTPGPRRFP